MVSGLALTATPAVVAAGDDGKTAVDPQARAAGSTDRERATAALERAKALFSGKARLAAAIGGGRPCRAPDPDATIVLRDLFSVARRPDPRSARGGACDPGPPDRRRLRPVRRRLHRAVGEEVPGQLLHPLGDLDRGRAAQPDLGQPDAAADEQGLEEGGQEARLPAAGLRPRSGRQQQVRRLPRADRRQGLLRLLRARAPQAGLRLGGRRLLRARQRHGRVRRLQLARSTAPG